MVRLNGKLLEKLMIDCLQAHGVCVESATHVAKSLIQTSLRGVDSHGIQLFPHYCRAVAAGRINKSPQFVFDRTSPTTAILDADDAFGHHAGVAAIDQAVLIAKEYGMGAVPVKNSSHFGAAAYFGLRAAQQGCIGLAFTNGDSLIKAYNSKVAFTGTNPICFTAPIDGEEPFCLDMATSLVAWNKIVNHCRTGRAIPENWACDATGLPVKNPNDAKSLQPAGGYKGYGLALVVDILCAMLSGSPASKDLIPMYESISTRRKLGHFFMALDISRFCLPSDFGVRMRDLVQAARGLPALDNEVPVLVPGDPEKAVFIERSKSGIPVDGVKLAEFIAITNDFERAIC